MTRSSVSSFVVFIGVFFALFQSALAFSSGKLGSTKNQSKKESVEDKRRGEVNLPKGEIELPRGTSKPLTPWQHAKATFTDAFDSTGLMILGMGAVATLAAMNFDQSMHDNWAHNQRMDHDMADFGNFWGQGFAEAGIVAGQLLFDRENGIADGEGLLASTLVTYAMKYSVGRERPDSDTRTSFPSGHAETSFALATSLTRSYGWGVGIPAYTLAVVTGLSRLADNAHWFSDVVAGTTIGIIFGRAPFAHHALITPIVFDKQGSGFGLLARACF